MSNIDEKFDKAEKVVDRTKSLLLKVVGGLVAIGLAIFVGLDQLAGDEPLEAEPEYYDEAIIEDDSLEVVTITE